MSENQQALCAEFGVLSGEIDIATAPVVQPRLMRVAATSRSNTVTFHCSPLTFIDSSGVSMLLEVAERTGKQVRLARVNRACARVFEVLNLCGKFAVERLDPSEG